VKGSSRSALHPNLPSLLKAAVQRRLLLACVGQADDSACTAMLPTGSPPFPDSELPDGGVSVVWFYAEFSQPIIDLFVHFGRLASSEGSHLHHVAFLPRIALD
jgi:hypothetical protein